MIRGASHINWMELGKYLKFESRKKDRKCGEVK